MTGWFHKYVSVWFQAWWYPYLLARRACGDEPWLKVLWCRWRGHPAGIVYYNPGGTEPDNHCKNCGDDLG